MADSLETLASPLENKEHFKMKLFLTLALLVTFSVPAIAGAQDRPAFSKFKATPKVDREGNRSIKITYREHDPGGPTIKYFCSGVCYYDNNTVAIASNVARCIEPSQCTVNCAIRPPRASCD